jgi:hypothetical protein
MSKNTIKPIFNTSPNRAQRRSQNDIFDMTQYKSRIRICPVRNMRVTEYQIPHDLILRLPKLSQPRVQDCSETAVIEKAEQMKGEMGQITGISVLANKKENRFLVTWGNTRFRGSVQLEGRGEKISNCEKGHIWASLYEHNISDLKKFQAIENNIHEHTVPATLDDNINSILSMLSDGVIPNYPDLDEEIQRDRVKDLYDDCKMPSSKFQSLWNQIRKKNKATSRKMRTYDKSEIMTYYSNNNDYDIPKEDCVYHHRNLCIVNVEKDNIEERWAIYIVSKVSEFGGATLANSNWARNIRDRCDRVIVVASLNDSKGKDINKTRKGVVKKIKMWNPSLTAGKSVDRILFMPQTEIEQQNELIAGDFIMDTSF